MGDCERELEGPNIGRDKQQQALAQALYYQAKALEPTRLVAGNDGWEMTATDLCAIHHYDQGGAADEQAHRHLGASLATREARLAGMPAGRLMYALGNACKGEPILLTECGGVSLKEPDAGAWGYTPVEGAEGLAREYERPLGAIERYRALYGFCYTQLRDVEQETNGLLTYDRRYKAAPEVIRAANDRVKGF